MSLCSSKKDHWQLHGKWYHFSMVSQHEIQLPFVYSDTKNSTKFNNNKINNYGYTFWNINCFLKKKKRKLEQWHDEIPLLNGYSKFKKNLKRQTYLREESNFLFSALCVVGVVVWDMPPALPCNKPDPVGKLGRDIVLVALGTAG